MQKKRYTITSPQNGAPVMGVPIAIQNYPSGTVATIYSVNDTGSTPISGGIVTTDVNGVIEFYAPDGRYQYYVTPIVGLPYLISDVMFGDLPAYKANLAASTGSSLMGHIASGTGAVPTTDQAKLREIVSLEDFGGSRSASAATNDIAFANAFAAAKTVFLQSEGTYDFSSGLSLLGKTLKGKSKTATILNYTGNGVALTVGGADSNAPGLQDFMLTGTASATGGLVLGITGNGCRRGKFSNLLVSGFTGAGVYGIDIYASAALAGSYYNIFESVGSEGNAKGWRCASLASEATNRANANTFINCTGISNTGDGWYFDYAVGNVMIGCDRESNGGFGINIDHGDLTIVGGYSEGNTSGWLKKTANGNVSHISGHIVDTTSSIVYKLGDVLLGLYQGFTVEAGGGIGMNGANAIADSINQVNTHDLALCLSGATYFYLGHTNGLNVAQRAIALNGAVKSSSSGVLSLAGVLQGYVEVTLTENITSITMPSSIDGFEINILFKQSAGGGNTIAGWPASVLLAGGAYTMTATASKYDHLRFRYHSGFAKWFEISRSQNM